VSDAFQHRNEVSAVADAFTDQQLHDIQGFAIPGFRKDHQELLFVSWPTPAAGRSLLAWLQPLTASAWEVGQFNQLFAEIKLRTSREPLCVTWLGVLISALGYQALQVSLGGLPAGDAATAFTAGMAARAQQIGDVDAADAPTAWLPEFRPGSGVHACLVVASDREDDLDAAVAELEDQVSAAGCEVVFQERGHTLPGALQGHEHFGFKDGISQPAIAGYDDDPAANEPPAAPPGEFVLGYPTASGQANTPAGSLWTDGSFAVFRRLTQDVAEFRAQAQGGVAGANPALDPDQFAAAMVGRWPSGAPLELNVGATSDPGQGAVSNAFQYQEAPFNDNDGHVCPRFAHIRKVNPRDETTPNPATDSPALHRMLRRGIPFGPVLPGSTPDDGKPRGLHFFCVVSDVVRQFEFIQAQWVNNANFPSGQPSPSGGLYGPPPEGTPDGPDPIAAEGDGGAECSLVQSSGTHQFGISTQLVHVTAGEYFFVPGIAAMQLLAGGTAQ
jgi:Dyp-type peroxidase family